MLAEDGISGSLPGGALSSLCLGAGFLSPVQPSGGAGVLPGVARGWVTFAGMSQAGS